MFKFHQSGFCISDDDITITNDRYLQVRIQCSEKKTLQLLFHLLVNHLEKLTNVNEFQHLLLKVLLNSRHMKIICLLAKYSLLLMIS